MPVTIKTVNLKYKNSQGEYVGVNTVGETTTEEQVAAIEAKGEEVLESIPADYSELAAEVGTKADKVSGATNGNFAALDSNGNLTDSGKNNSDYATAEQASALKSAIDGKAPVILRTASGDIVTISDGADGMPLSAVVSIDPVQAAGTPSPENPLAISGWTGANIKRTGRNMLPTAGYTDVTRNALDTTLSKELQSVMVGKSSAFVISGTTTPVQDDSNTVSINVYYTDGTSATTLIYRGVNHVNGLISGPWSIVLNTGKTISDVHMGGNTGSAKVTLSALQLEHGSTVHAYAPYQGQTYAIDWQTAAGTVYKGNFDTKSGKLTVDKASVTYDGSEDENWAYYSISTGNLFRIVQSDRKTENITMNAATRAKYICNSYVVAANSTTGRTHGTFSGSTNNVDFVNDSYSTVEAFRAYLAQNPVQFIYPLAEPLVYQLDPVEIETLLGENHLWADTGAVALTYPADTQTYVDTLVQTATDPDGNVVQVSGSTPSITGESGKRYVCGTVDSITITPPQTGIIDVVFSSGTTPTVLTVPSSVKFPAWFDATSLDASTTYEINVQDGVYGAVMAWT